MKKKLTKEELIQRFNSPFDLVNYSIKIAKGMINSGNLPTESFDGENVATLILNYILEEKDQIDLSTQEKQEPQQARVFSNDYVSVKDCVSAKDCVTQTNNEDYS